MGITLNALDHSESWLRRVLHLFAVMRREEGEDVHELTEEAEDLGGVLLGLGLRV